jgi:DNA-binding transcriptional LysR family regulator
MDARQNPDDTLLGMPSLRALRAFVAAAKHQSFTRAAEALCVTQAAISRQVRELETQLGTPLFVRAGRAVQLTAEGEVLFDAAQLSFINLAQAAQRLRGPARAKASLTLCCSPAFAALWLQPRLADFRLSHPDIALRVIATPSFLGLDTSLRPDVIISKLSAIGDAYTSERLFHDVIYPVCSPAYQQAHGPLETLAQLREAELLDLSPHGRAQLAEHVDWSVWLALHHAQVKAPAAEPRVVLASNDYALLVQLAVQGQGVTLGWRHLVAPMLADGRLVRPLRESLEHRERCHHLSMRADRAEHEACRQLRAWLLAQCADSP